MNNKPTFRIGICMAGAVSAGAYTAGVIDYLLEALDNWERAKKLQEENKLEGVPKHHVLIEVLSGASAGGMTAAITAAAIQTSFPPMNKEEKVKQSADKKNPLYNSWVNLIETDEKDMMDCMLSNDDIENDPENKDKEVRSGFNSKFISEIAEDVLTKTVKDNNCKRPYIADDLDVFTTITNLRGYNYKVTFTTNQGVREHRMRMHRDIAFFQLNDKGEYKKNGRIPLHFIGKEGLNKKTLAQAAMSTGAFPVGLESRELIRERDHIIDNKYLNLHLSASTTENVYYHFLPNGNFESLNVDGGVINNEPFEVTQQLLDDRRKAEINIFHFTKAKAEGKTDKEAIEEAEKEAAAYTLQTEAKRFDTTVIMVDPFPNDEDELSTSFTPLKAWKFAVPKIISAMRGQLMMKDSEIRKAYLSEDYTKFLIVPVRQENDTIDSNKKEKKVYSIACGSFGGFGGFFSKKFREHDFYLGRRNCQRFLQRYLSVPVSANNPIINYGYSGIKDDYSFEIKVQLDETNNNTENKIEAIKYLPIIPDIRVQQDANGNFFISKPEEEYEQECPKISLSYLLSIEKKCKKRLECILNNLTNGNDPEKQKVPQNPIVQRIRKKSQLGRIIGKVITDPLTKFYLNIGKSASKGPLAEKFINSVIEDMDKRRLLNVDV